MALFDGTIEQFRTFVPGLTTNYTLEDALPELTAAEQALLPKFLGDDIAQQLSDLGSEMPDDASNKLERALYLAQVAVGRIGFANYLPFAEVQVGDDGVTITNSDNRKAAFEYQTKKVQKRLLEEGWRALDDLISLIDKNPVLFPKWPESPYYAEHQKALFKTPAAFSKYYPIQDRWLTFWALRPFILNVEENSGEEAMARIDALPGDTDAAKVEKARRNLLRALAYQAVFDGLPHLSVELNGANVQVNYASQYGNAEYYEPPGKDHLSWVMDNLKKQLDLAWSTFDTTLAGLVPSTDSTQPKSDLLYSNGAITFL